MRMFVLISAVTLMAVGSSQAFAFEVVNSEQFNNTLSTRLADPDDVIQNMSQQYAGKSAQVFHSGSTTIGIVGPSGGAYAGESPFLADPAAGTVPSKRQW